MAASLVRWFSDLGVNDVPVVGGKNASLGEMISTLSEQGIRVPDGFATTADAYWHFVDAAGIRDTLSERIGALRAGDAPLERVGADIRRAFLHADMPDDLRQTIVESYHALGEREENATLDVAVRSSATAEDLPTASFAGQQETFLNVHGERALLDACRRCYASLFTDRAISYRESQGFDHLEVALSIGVQTMVRSDLASSGVMFTLDTDSGFRDMVLINAAWGLGETVVQGIVDPDEYAIFKPLLDDETKVPIVGKDLGAKEKKMVYTSGGTAPTKTQDTSRQEREAWVLNDDEIVTLARWEIGRAHV